MDYLYDSMIIKKEKCDLHCHAARGAEMSYIGALIGKRITEKEKFNSVDEMNQWYREEIGNYFSGRQGYEFLINATIKQAIEDKVRYLELGFAIDRIRLYGFSVENFIEAINNIIKKYSEIKIIPEISVPKTSEYKKNIFYAKEAIGLHFFKSIDIVGEELEVDFEHFVDLYREAKRKGLRLRAHVGEFGSADSVRRTCDLLELDEVQHGVHASESIEVMRYLRNNKIQLNICPTSNIKMKVTNDYRTHPIRKLFDMGILVTINTDDRLIFNKSLSEEYIALYENKCFSISELEDIRITTLERCRKLWEF